MGTLICSLDCYCIVNKAAEKYFIILAMTYRKEEELGTMFKHKKLPKEVTILFSPTKSKLNFLLSQLNVSHCS
jgi:hypothetical protein